MDIAPPDAANVADAAAQCSIMAQLVLPSVVASVTPPPWPLRDLRLRHGIHHVAVVGPASATRDALVMALAHGMVGDAGCVHAVPSLAGDDCWTLWEAIEFQRLRLQEAEEEGMACTRRRTTPYAPSHHEALPLVLAVQGVTHHSLQQCSEAPALFREAASAAMGLVLGVSDWRDLPSEIRASIRVLLMEAGHYHDVRNRNAGLLPPPLRAMPPAMVLRGAPLPWLWYDVLDMSLSTRAPPEAAAPWKPRHQGRACVWCSRPKAASGPTGCDSQASVPYG